MGERGRVEDGGSLDNADNVIGWCWKQSYEPFEVWDEEAEEDGCRIRRCRSDDKGRRKINVRITVSNTL